MKYSYVFVQLTCSTCYEVEHNFADNKLKFHQNDDLPRSLSQQLPKPYCFAEMAWT